MTILTKKNLSILECSEKSNSSLYNLSSVLINPQTNMMWASNGHSLYGSVLTENNTDYPELGVNGVDSKECMLVSAEALRKAEKNIPSKTSMPILESVQVLIDEEYKHLVTSDLETTQDIKIKHLENNEWPDFQSAIIDRQPAAVPQDQKVVLSIKQLEVMVKVMKKANIETIEVIVNGPRNPVKVRSLDDAITGYVMPMAC